MSACVDPRVGLQLSRMSRKYTIHLNMSLFGGIWVEIVWHFGGDRAEKRKDSGGGDGTGWGRGQWWRERSGDGDNGGGGPGGMGIKLWGCGGARPMRFRVLITV